MFELGHLNEIVLHVEDIAVQTAFYRDQLGLEVRSTSDLPNARTELDTGACRLVLDASLKPGPPANRTRFVFTVAELVGTRRELLARGVRLSPIYAGPGGRLMCDGSDPEGNLFSLIDDSEPVTTTITTGSNVPYTTGRRVWAV
jgi:catechol-2,3-dioxygenase